jgi:hypothetical protein
MLRTAYDWYETHQTAFGLKEGCIDKLNRCKDRKICGKLPVSETVKTLVKSILSADCLELKHTNRMSNKVLHTESAVRYKHHM